MRLKISKSKNSTSFSIIKSVYIGKKNTSKIVESLGSLSSLKTKLNTDEKGVYAWLNHYVDELNAQYDKDKESFLVKFESRKQLPLHAQTSFNGGYLFLQDIFYKLQLHTLCDQITSKYKFDFDLTDILSRLIYTRILSPSSKLSSFQSSKDFIEAPKFDLHQIYRSLDILAEQSSFIQAEVYKNSVHLLDRNTNILYYDCTNYFFEIEQEEGLKQYGLSKEHRPNPIVQMGLFMDGNGLPLAFCLEPGNQNEQISLKPLENQIIQDFKLSKFIVCTDAGLGSTENRLFNNFSNRSYIVTQSLKKLKKHLIDWALESKGWHLLGEKKEINLQEIQKDKTDVIYYKERWINENGLEQRLIITYSPKYQAYQQTLREAQLLRANKIIKSKSVDKRNQNDPKRFIDLTHMTEHGEVAVKKIMELNEEAILQEARFDGFYGLCTTLEDKAEDIIRINQRRWEIEESFRIMKSEFKARPVYLKNDNRITAHFLTCFLALLIYRILEKKLEEEYTPKTILSTLKQFNFHEIKGEGYIPTYTRTECTDSLHQAFGFRTDTQIVMNKEMKKIINKTKSKK